EGLEVILEGINSVRERLEEDIGLTDSECGVMFVGSEGEVVIKWYWREKGDMYDWGYDLVDGNFTEKDMGGLI
ncbi:hypothetical protein, partial [Paenibacillus xylanexedens]|uniref:hypothetical protein n=1 Tax=Paenibacillus xylanexedens TaxID=528191 RepID=UPI001C92C140